MKPVRIIFGGLLCGVISTAHADIASVQYVQSIISSLDIPSAQSDWNQTDSTADDFIKNKPTIPTTAAEVGAVPTSRTVNGNALSADVTLDGADIAVTGYTKPASTSAIAASDTVNAAIGKLETAIDGKQDKLVATAGATQNITGSGSVTVTQDANGKITITGAETDVSGKQDKLGGSGDDGKAIIAGGTAGNVTYRAIDTTNGGTSASTDLITSGAVNAGLAGKVSTSTTVNGNALSSNVTLDGADIAVTGYTKPATTSAIAATDTVNAAIGKLETALDGKQAAGNYVPTSTTVNGSALSSNVTLDGADITLTGYSLPASTSAVAATDTVNGAIGKLEKAILPVGTTSGTVAAGDDARFNTVSTTQPSGTPPTGTVFMWFN